MPSGDRILKRTNPRIIRIEMINTDLLFVVVMFCLLLVICKYRANCANHHLLSNLAKADKKRLIFPVKQAILG
jgi:hypothetical protein